MDEISRYIIHNSDQVMNDVERRAHTAFLLRQKAEAAKGTKVEEYFSDSTPTDAEARALVEKGYEGFIESVRERVMREDKEKKYLNYCPRCNALARTPTARQCPKCYFSWHKSESA